VTRKNRPVLSETGQAARNRPSIRAPQAMSDKKIDVVCKNCGQAFSAFLRDMAEHNAKVVCPNCGKVYDRDETMAAAKDPP
jgi:hypothetical protein